MLALWDRSNRIGAPLHSSAVEVAIDDLRLHSSFALQLHVEVKTFASLEHTVLPLNVSLTWAFVLLLVLHIRPAAALCPLDEFLGRAVLQQVKVVDSCAHRVGRETFAFEEVEVSWLLLATKYQWM